MSETSNTNHVINKSPDSLMSSKRFLPLFITQFFFTFNDNTFKNALLIWFTYDIAQKTGQKPDLMISIAIGFYITPLFLFSAMAGQFADKFDKSTIAKILMLGEIIVMICGVILFYLQSVFGLVFILFLAGLIFTFLVPVKYSLLPEHLGTQELIKGNGFIEGGTFIATLIGTIFGGLIIDYHYGLAIMALTLITTTILAFIASWFIPKSPAHDSQAINWNFLKETKHILSYATANRQVLLIILAISWFWLVSLTFLTHFATYTKLTIHGTEGLVTFFLTLFSIGIAIGTLLCNKLLHGKISTKYIPASSLVISLSIFLFCIFSYLYAKTFAHEFGLLTDKKVFDVASFMAYSVYSSGIVTTLFIMSVACGVYIIPLYSALQHLSEQRFVARIIAANNVLNALFMGLASLLSFVLAKFYLDIVQTIAIVGALNLIVFVYLLKSKLLHIDIAND